MLKHSGTYIWVAAVVGALVLLNILGLRAFGRFDLTRDKVYTLAAASREAVKDLKEPLTISAYFTEQLPPPYSDNARYVRDLLEEFRSASNGKVSFEFVDPMSQETDQDKELKKEVKQDIFGRTFREPTSIEKELAGLGLQNVEIHVFEDDQRQTKRAYMGIVIRHQEKHEVIPVVQDVRSLEYDLTSLIRKLTRAKAPVIGLAVSQASGDKVGRLTTMLSQTYEVRRLELGNLTSIPEEVDALWVVGPSQVLGAGEQRAIDQFLMKGKSVALFLDSVQVDIRSFEPAMVEHGLAPMLATYGVNLSDQIVADVQSAQLNVEERRGFMVVQMPVPYPFIPMLTQLEGDSPVSKGLTALPFPFATKVSTSSSEGRTSAVLAKSSAKSWLESKPYNLDPRREWRSETITPNGPHELMVQLTGRFKSHFAADVSVGAQPTLTESQADGRLLVAGTSSLLWDNFMGRPNQVLALNIADWMLMDPSMLAMRSRDFIGAPLEPEVDSVSRNLVKFGNTIAIPLLLAAYGLLRWMMRNGRRKVAAV